METPTSTYLYASNKYIDFGDIQEDKIDIRDIARNLSMESRFNGNTKFFYSVGLHSILMSYQASKDIRLETLLHDAEEAYIKDVTLPVKRILRQVMGNVTISTYAVLAELLKEKIRSRFKLKIDNYTINTIKEIDNRMATTERLQLQEKALRDISLKHSPYDITIPEVSFTEVEAIFLRLFNQYKLERENQNEKMA